VTLAGIEFREAAIADLLQIHAHLRSEASLQLADRFLMAVERTTQQIRRYPNAGALFRTQRSSLTGLRWWSVTDFPRYLLYYIAGADRLDMVRVLHGSRDTKRELRET
jgi:plasmid stabilization system protein ParE